MDINFDKQHEELKIAQKLADNGFIDAAISVVDEVFPSFRHFRSWYLVYYGENEFSEKFMDWVAKIETFMWSMQGVEISEEDAQLVIQTYLELYPTE